MCGNLGIRTARKEVAEIIELLLCTVVIQLLCKLHWAAVSTYRALLSCSIDFHFTVCFILYALMEQINDDDGDDDADVSGGDEDMARIPL